MQLNLCDSGIAPCYTGRSVAQAAAVIRTARPDVVTLNEVCTSDVATLERTLSRSRPKAVVLSAFRSAVDRRTGDPVRCSDGDRYGIGLLASVSRSQRQHATYGALYPAQDPSDVEKRFWLCVHESAAQLYACTTHLDSVTPGVARQQCRYLLHTALPGIAARHGPDPVLLGADLNLLGGLRSCAPHGDALANDSGRQYIVAGPGFRVASSRTIDMRGTTDHPALLVDLTRSGLGDMRTGNA